MKNRFIIFTAAFVIAACAALSGCSCAGCGGDNTLSFSSAFSGGEAPKTANYTETLEYEVKYDADYLSNSKKDAELDKYVQFEYADNGTCVSEFAIATPAELAEIKSNVKADERVKDVYKITTEFSIDLAITTLNGKPAPFTHTETISTVAYIASAGAAFAPLYAKEWGEYCTISAQDKAEIVITEYENTTLYNTDKYTKTLKYREYGIGETPSDYKTESDTVKYDFLEAIDNAEFIFALRGIELNSEKDTKTVPVVSLGYKKPTSLKITNTAKTSATMEINYSYNGTSTVINESVKYNVLEFHVDSTNTTGLSQYIHVQSAKTESLPNLALPLKFAKPLIVYGSTSMMKMGGLVFTLQSVIINN